MAMSTETVRDLFREGVEAIERVGSELTAEGWAQRVCGHWTAEETARHLLCVSRWYHSWLDRALSGDASPPFPASDLDAQNAAALLELAHLEGAEAIAAFADTARAYLARVGAHWDLPFGYPFGSVTAGLHCGVAATEWHLHAWDLSEATGERHQPLDPRGLFTAAGTCIAAARGGASGAVIRLLVPLGARRAPWATLLVRSGRR